MLIAIHAYDGVPMFHLATPLAVFREVARLGLADWRTLVWSDDGPELRTSEGLTLGAVAGADAADEAEVIVLPAWPTAVPQAAPELLDRVRRAHDRGAQIVGLCLGAFPLAETGLLDDREATTHWELGDLLAARHPRVLVRPAALYIDHGDVLTSAGTASGLDACLHVVRSRLGAEAATAVARRLVVAPHRVGTQAQFIEHPIAPEPADDPIGATMTWALGRLDRPLPLAALAAHAVMSPRHFSRRFRAATGTSPADWIAARRLDAARRLLETTDLPVSEVAVGCGFVSPVTFRQRFARAYGSTPSAYRARFAEAI